jgi:hypothetical protein
VGVLEVQYDSDGALRAAAFAQTKSGEAGAPGEGGSWYGDHPAQRRVRAYYAYGLGRRLAAVEHYADEWGGSSYTSKAVLGQAMAYDPTTGRKTSATTMEPNGSGGWQTAYIETYGYDAETGFLTSAQYSDDGSWNGSWAYDASGNRTGAGWGYDRLDRMTASPGIQNYVHDAAGNRLWRDHMVNSQNVVKHTWDELNRMKSVQTSQDGSVNFYRPDGMRARRDGASLAATEESSLNPGHGFTLSRSRPSPLAGPASRPDPRPPGHRETPDGPETLCARPSIARRRSR